MHPIKTILHPTGFSDNSALAFQMACGLAADYGATLILLHVRPESRDPFSARAIPDPSKSAESQETIGQFPWPKPPDPRVRVEHRLAEGEAPTEILRVAKSENCDLIVMGTHGRTGFGRLLSGSVAEAVTRRAPCPVLAVKSPIKGLALAATVAAQSPPAAPRAAAVPPTVAPERPMPDRSADAVAPPPATEKSNQSYADLAALLESWSTLPAPIRAGILAMIRSQAEG
jgi:nucleotide-binding universal stress UspA family protein